MNDELLALLKKCVQTFDDAANFLKDEQILPCESGDNLAEELVDLAVECRNMILAVELSGLDEEN